MTSQTFIFFHFVATFARGSLPVLRSGCDYGIPHKHAYSLPMFSIGTYRSKFGGK